MLAPLKLILFAVGTATAAVVRGGLEHANDAFDYVSCMWKPFVENLNQPYYGTMMA
jgi:hypothetical protein